MKMQRTVITYCIQGLRLIRKRNLIFHIPISTKLLPLSIRPISSSDIRQVQPMNLDGCKNVQIKVLYDGQCPICLTEINLMKRLNKDNTVKFVDITVGDYNPADHQGISYQQAMGKMHVIDKNQKVYDSMQAMKIMYSAVGLDWFSRLLSLPGIKQTADKFYVWFAINRYRLTGRNREECESGRCHISEKPRNG